MGGIFLNSWRGAAAKADAAAVEAVAIGEQQTKRTTSGGRSRSGRNREAVGNREQLSMQLKLKPTQAASSS